jgi:O-antigen ligase
VLSVLTSFFASASSDPSISSRTADYAAVSEEVARSPFLGHGYGTWYAPVHQIFDNEYLLTLVESGVVGLLSTVLVLGVAIWRSLSVDKRSYSRQSLSISCTASLAIVAVTSATFDFSSFPIVNTMAFVVVGLVGALDRDTDRRGGTS